ncbi:arsenite methyltransferase isoform X2 [Polyodon spathula]|uniref:arsenite methyltransferase isoform X2 n=1 Tax=Polyodon spathula TaxID=7913 RepID=UPI001B7F38FC|nr:arsenite methyltransferase isoform X2 [Polyodon spathula]
MSECCANSSDSVPACDSKASTIHSDVKDYYGKQLQKSEDLKTNACTTSAKPTPAFIRKALKEVHSEITSRYYGCGLVVPESLESCRVLDLGCGSGQDCFMLSQLVGEKGHVTGIDMTEEQLAVARKHIDYHTKKFGFKKPNVDFVQGYMELLGEAGLKDSSYDIIISNCVVNLSPDKAAVLREVYRVLKDGGEMYFSDVYSNQALTKEIREHRVLWGECLGGALWWEDLVRLAQEVGFSPPRLVTASHVAIGNKELESIVGDYKFVSATYRLFKVPKSCPKERSQVIYNGSITNWEQFLEFDANYTFKEGEAMVVDGDAAAILRSSRFADDFMIRPVEGGAAAGVGCCPVKPKEIIVNPFELAKRLEPADIKPATGGCCGTKASGCS